MMRTRLRAIVLGILILASGFVHSIDSRVYAAYDTSKVYTMIGDTKYSIVDGNKLYREDKKIFDLTRYTWPTYDLVEYDDAMAKTLLITDISHTYWDGEPILFMVGLAFKAEPIDYNDTSNYKNMQIKLGTPHAIIFSFNINNGDIYPYSETGFPVHLEGSKDLDPIWGMPYKSQFNEVDESETYTTLFNYAEGLVFPRIQISKYRKDTGYVLLGDDNDYKLTDKGRFIKIYSIKTTRDPDLIYKGKYSYEQFYATFKFFEDDVAAVNNIPFKVDPYSFFFWEEARDIIVVANQGEKYSVCGEVDVSIYKKPKLKATYWKTN